MFWVRSDLESGKKIRVFNFWGEGEVFWVRSVSDSRKKIRVFNFQGGMFWVRSDLESGKNFRVFNFWEGEGGVLGKVSFRLWKEN